MNVSFKGLVSALLICSLLVCFGENTLSRAETYSVGKISIADGYVPPTNKTIIHYLNEEQVAYTKIANKVTELYVGEHHRLTVALNKRTNATIRWYSSDKKVATIGLKTGNIVAKMSGKTTIAMKDLTNKVTERFTLTIKEIPVLPEIPEEWYWVENIKKRVYLSPVESKYIDGVQLVLKEKYQDLYEQCTMLKIPETIEGKPVLHLIREDREEFFTVSISLPHIGFTNLKYLQCSNAIRSNCEVVLNSEANEGFKFVLPENTEYLDYMTAYNGTWFAIPESVKYIDLLNFKGNQTVRIPASVKCIGGDGAYTYRGILNSVNFQVDGNNPNYYSIFGVLFSYPCENERRFFDINVKDVFLNSSRVLQAYPQNKKDEVYYVPEGVEIIGTNAFSENQYLKKIVLPDSVKEIWGLAFALKNDVEIVIPSSVTVLQPQGEKMPPFGGAPGIWTEDELYEGYSYATKNITIVTPKGSAAEKYAVEHKIKYRNE